MNTMAPILADLASIKNKQQTAWASGDYAVVGSTLQLVGEQLCEVMEIGPADAVLDVAAGNGNATLAAARRFAQVTSTDYVPSLLESGRRRAAADGLDVTFQVADAEALPFADGEFDAVVSTFGVMFTPNQDKAAEELLRVCRPGGRIGMANWTPESFVGQLFKTIGAYIPPAPGMKSPAQWGTEARLHEMFGAKAAGIAITRRHFMFRYRTASHWLDIFRSFYGPLHKAFAALDVEKQAGLERDVLALLGRMDTGTATLRVPSEYLEVIVTKR
jgi:ubiquinone/menaquinone biosynthesis C-methylase UbiE